jgi:uncharacterized protein YjbI with pentapeptide repeats
MPDFEITNPFLYLTGYDREQVSQIQFLPNVDFLQAVELLKIDPKSDFICATLSGVNFSNLDLGEFDFSGSIIEGCQFINSQLPVGIFKIGNRFEVCRSHDHARILKSLSKLVEEGRVEELPNKKSALLYYLNFRAERGASLKEIHAPLGKTPS